MIIVTGGAGFIGSNLVKTLNAQGRSDIIVVDDLADGHKFVNLADCDIADYLDKDDFLHKLKNNFEFSEKVDVVFHQGACSATTEWNGKFMMENNYEYSKSVLHYCMQHKIPLIYASSAAVYGGSTVFKEQRQYEKPLNVYGYSKSQFDCYVETQLPKAGTQIVGLRYFNVYGPREQHKGSMASVAFHFNNQLKSNGVVKLFEGSGGYTDGEQLRDFIYISDVVKVNLWFMQNAGISGVFNCGTGRSQSFNAVAKAAIQYHGKGKINYIAFPEGLRNAYQSFTEANLSKLRAAGYKDEFKTVEEAVPEYLAWLNQSVLSVNAEK